MEQRIPHQLYTVILATLSLTATIALFLLASNRPRVMGDETPRLARIFLVSASDKPRNAMKLKEADRSFTQLEGSSFVTDKQYAYLWVRLENDTAMNSEAIIVNRSYNEYTEMLAPDIHGAAVLFRQGDALPVDELPLRHIRTAFPVIVAPHESIEFVIEFRDARGVVIDPDIVTPAAFFNRASGERALLSCLYGIMATIIFLYLLYGMIFRHAELLSLSAFTISLCLYSLGQNRLVRMVLANTPFPDWLLPLCVGLTIVTGLSFVSRALDRTGSPRRRRTLAVSAVLTASLVAVAFLGEPRIALDWLNLVGFVVLSLSTYAAYKQIKAGDIVLAWKLCGFLPWAATMVVDVLVSCRGGRLSSLAEYRQTFGLAATLALLSVAFLGTIRFEEETRVRNLTGELAGERADIARRFSSVANLSAAVYRQAGHILRQPLDGIAAMARMLRREYSDPRIAAASALMIDEIESLRRRVDEAVGSQQEPASAPVLTEATGTLGYSSARALGAVCLYNRDTELATRKALILQAEGFKVTMETDQHALFGRIGCDDIDVLVVDSDSVGDEAFNLCGQIRAEHSMLELPILMVISQSAEYQRRKGYAAGVNDFLTRPFSAAELSARVLSLAKLRQVARYNHDLSRSEKEKNAFLYFLTHNVNTPLTVLLNRARELEGGVLPDQGCIDDIRATSREISDIVQNVLISFRLADGRQTIRLEPFDLSDTLAAIERELAYKAMTKGQNLKFDVPREPIPAYGDPVTIRGIIYNVADNAVKFSPRGGTISVAVTAINPVRVEVRDSGPGIPAAERNRLFCRFEALSPRPTAGESSTGLGLYVAAELARMNGGALEYVDIDPGACFRLTLATHVAMEVNNA